jgi:hypothetical protein
VTTTAARCDVRWQRFASPISRASSRVYIDGRDLHVIRVTDGTDVVVRRPTVGPVHAQLESPGLFYSAGRNVFFIPRSELDRRLRSG